MKRGGDAAATATDRMRRGFADFEPVDDRAEARRVLASVKPWELSNALLIRWVRVMAGIATEKG